MKMLLCWTSSPPSVPFWFQYTEIWSILHSKHKTTRVNSVQASKRSTGPTSGGLTSYLFEQHVLASPHIISLYDSVSKVFETFLNPRPLTQKPRSTPWSLNGWLLMGSQTASHINCMRVLLSCVHLEKIRYTRENKAEKSHLIWEPFVFSLSVTDGVFHVVILVLLLQ